jgi:hypothetical protein
LCLLYERDTGLVRPVNGDAQVRIYGPVTKLSRDTWSSLEIEKLTHG